MIIDTSYFLYYPLYIPNVVTQPSIGSNTPTHKDELMAAIESMEYQLLVNALGVSQYNELKAQFNPDGSWIDTPMQKWKDLVDGKDNWIGLRYTTGNIKQSLIANYVYYQFMNNLDAYYSITGLQKANDANATAINPAYKLVPQWNNFVAQYQGIINYCYCISAEGNSQSLYGFLSANRELYDITYFSIYNMQNAWGI